MSNKLAKNKLTPAMQKAIAEQNSQYACLFALAAKALHEHGGKITLMTDDVNTFNRKGIKFVAIDKDGNEWKQQPDWRPGTNDPVGVMCVLEDHPLSRTQGLDA